MLSRTLSKRPLREVLLLATLPALVALALPALALAHPARPGASHGTYDDGHGDRFSWGLFVPGDGAHVMDTDGDDWREIQRVMRDEDQRVLWFRLDGQNYVVRDAAIVERADEMAAPVRALGEKQGRLGKRQGELGEQQSRLGARQASLGARQARLSAQLSRLAYTTSEDEQRGARAERRRIEIEIRELARQQGELGHEQGSLGQIQGELGRQQGELGREQARVGREVGEQIRRLAEAALREGKARPVGRTL